MTDREKIKFLRAEGWKTKRFSPTSLEGGVTYYYCGPIGSMLYTLPEAYRIAKRRKDARDRRKLHAAGMHWDEIHGWCHELNDAQIHGGYTKAEALATLEAG